MGVSDIVVFFFEGVCTGFVGRGVGNLVVRARRDFGVV